jgi:hypothetical protein
VASGCIHRPLVVCVEWSSARDVVLQHLLGVATCCVPSELFVKRNGIAQQRDPIEHGHWVFDESREDGCAQCLGKLAQVDDGARANVLALLEHPVGCEGEGCVCVVRQGGRD